MDEARQRAFVGGANPDFAHLRHAVPLAVGWEQVQEFIVLPRKLLLAAPPDPGRRHPAPDPGRRQPPAAPLDAARFHTTLEYLYCHMRCGVYVLIRDGRVALFVPFVNPNFANAWWPHVRIPGGSVGAYYAQKSAALRKPVETGIIAEPSLWWVNAGGIVCNQASAQLWGDGDLPQHRAFLDAVCEKHAIPDVEFFLNRRDHPQLRKDGREPYAFCWPESPPPLLPPRWREQQQHAPVLSGYTGPDFQDVPWPLMVDDVAAPAAAAGPPWHERAPVAVWRGSATGAGVTPDTNQRLALVALSAPGRLDAQLTAGSSRDRIVDGQLRWMPPPRKLAPRLSPEQQRAWKYVVYVQGHSAASRYGALMASGSVILKVASTCAAPDLWFFHHLRPWVDHVPVAADMRDLRPAIQWLQAHDAEAAAMARAAAELHAKLLRPEALREYAARTLATSFFFPATK